MAWIVGETPTWDNLDPIPAAGALAEFVKSLHGVSPAGGPVKSGTTRGVPLQHLDAAIRLAPALQGLRYYRDTRPDFVAAARHRIDAVLADRT